MLNFKLRHYHSLTMEKHLEVLKEKANDLFLLEVAVTQRLGGSILTRQKLIQYITGQEPQLKHCTISNLAKHLYNYFKQTKLEF